MTHVDLSQNRGGLRKNGPKIRIRVRRPEIEQEAARRYGSKQFAPKTVFAMIDTGASSSVVVPQVAVDCGLRKIDTVPVSTVGHISYRDLYAAAIEFVDHRLRGFDPLRVIASDLPHQENVEFLIGRDVLELWRIFYDGRTGEMWIEDQF